MLLMARVQMRCDQMIETQSSRRGLRCGLVCLMALSLCLPEPLSSLAAGTEAKNPADSAQESVTSSDSLLAELSDHLQALARDAENKVAQIEAGSRSANPFSGLKLKQLPPEPNLPHSANGTLHMGPFHQGQLIKIRLLQPIELDATYSESITLREALAYAIDHSLAIKISKESWNYQRWQYLGTLIAALPIPNFSTSYNLTKTSIFTSFQNSDAKVFQETLRFPVFQGGAMVYGAMSQYYRERGWRKAYYTSINDALLDVYQKYTTLALQHVLLHIRAKAVEVSEAQLRLNNSLYLAGSATKLAIMQSRTQLAQDREALIEQQIAVRTAALALSFALNSPMAINLIPQLETIQEAPLVPQSLDINHLFSIAANNRPDLREYEMFRLSAARNVQVAASALYPQASFFTSYTNSNTTVTPYSGIPSFTIGSASFQTTAGAGVFGGLFNTAQAGFTLSWSLSNMGLTAVVNTKSAQILARQAMWQANQALLQADEQVRADYDGMLTARSRIDNSAYGVASAREALRLANLRLASGMGTNIESIQADRDYINALVTQAQSIINSNQAQAQLLHDIGVISISNLLDGYRPGSKSSAQPGGT
jgi:outer membrane protein TolC